MFFFFLELILFDHFANSFSGVTGTCNKEHVPSWRDNAEALKAAGVDEVLCVSVNDACTVDAWASYVDPEGELTFVADPSLKFT
jgi:glutaredoxin/glutathione-dependent peroxiredoxin